VGILKGWCSERRCTPSGQLSSPATPVTVGSSTCVAVLLHSSSTCKTFQHLLHAAASPGPSPVFLLQSGLVWSFGAISTLQTSSSFPIGFLLFLFHYFGGFFAAPSLLLGSRIGTLKCRWWWMVRCWWSLDADQCWRRRNGDWGRTWRLYVEKEWSGR